MVVFRDPRAIHHDGRTFTGWISTTGNVWVASGFRAAAAKTLIYRGLGVDDHNNPSLVFRRDGHIVVFFSPHSGRHLPRTRSAGCATGRACTRTRSRSSGKVHTVDTNVPGGLGYTYPNPIQQRDKLWLFWRGGTGTRRSPTPATAATTGSRRASSSTSATSSGRTRSTRRRPQPHPRHLLRRPPELVEDEPALRALPEQRAVRGEREAARDVREPAAAHVQARPHLPLQRPWRARVAARRRARPQGRPYVVYTRRLGGTRDTFYYAYFNGTRWVSRKIVEAGRKAGLVHVGRGDARPRGSARGLPVAPDRDLVPGRALVHR